MIHEMVNGWDEKQILLAFRRLEIVESGTILVIMAPVWKCQHRNATKRFATRSATLYRGTVANHCVKYLRCIRPNT